MKLLEIACEVKRVCEENNITYWLDSGSCLGAVRHGGFIPWDDDMDIGMPRDDYERFRSIADDCLNERFIFQDWHTHDKYAVPYGKVRMKGTKYIESKAGMTGEDGFYVDIFPYDKWSNQKGIRKLYRLQRLLLMKNQFCPWRENDGISIKKWIGYLPYRILAKRESALGLKKEYECIIFSVEEDTGLIYEQLGWSKVYVYEKNRLFHTIDMNFEGIHFKVPKDYDYYLSVSYGDYMTLPPENQRYNRHQILEMDFGEDKNNESDDEN